MSGNTRVCQPVAVSFSNVPVARRCPLVAPQRSGMRYRCCRRPCRTARPRTKPLELARHFTPTSTAVGSGVSGVPGTVPSDQIEHGHCRGPAAADAETGGERLAESSTARARRASCPDAAGCEGVAPRRRRPRSTPAGCQVVPPSLETSTPATWPPASVTVPEKVYGAPTVAAGAFVIATVGAALSLLAVAATSPLCRVAGCTPMSARKLTVACLIRTSEVGRAGLERVLVVDTPGPLHGARRRTRARRWNAGTWSARASSYPSRRGHRSSAARRDRSMSTVVRDS